MFGITDELLLVTGYIINKTQIIHSNICTNAGKFNTHAVSQN